jgi:hypothetical protein
MRIVFSTGLIGCMFNTTFTRELQLLQLRVESMQFLTPTPISLGFILILSSYLQLGNSGGLFLVGLSVKILKSYTSILATCPEHLNLLDLISQTLLGERYKL